MNNVEKALEMNKSGYNCAQAVLCSFADQLGISAEQAFKVSEGFGGGMGGMMDTCGAVTALYMMEGLLNSSGTAENLTKGKTYKGVRDIAEQFKERNGSTVCRDLKGVDSGVVLTSCPECISSAVEIAEQMIKYRD